MPEPPIHPPERPVLALLQQLKDGSLHARTLSPDQRQQCVEALLLEGYSVPQIAQVVDRTERTVKRDIVNIRSRNAPTPSPELAKQLIGDLFMRTEAHHARLMRIAGSAEGSAGEKAQATFLAFRVLKERTELLQSLGYLQKRPQQVTGDFLHRIESGSEEQSLEVAEQAIAEIRLVAKESGGLLPEVAKELPILQEKLDQARLKLKAQNLLDRQKASDSREDSDG